MTHLRNRLIKRSGGFAALVLSALVGTGILVACDGGGQAPPASDFERGERLYVQHCQSCHPGGNRGAGPALRPALPGLNDTELTTIIRNGKTRMPGFGENEISAEELKLLIAYMRGW